ncbi:hypothetical protein H8A97_26370 [Bradyrhizobium sp. Arg62]|uniref:hypothetical protein n=1 Tax=Bradyrhizobium brasilense TaxID=1419277 RepID=UPI001E6010E2|nr:hypothetical protein [Bradyrhizobium brasilense]MCC8948541.1 hypothetical protein [Bradyrhizobium brasilense]
MARTERTLDLKDGSARDALLAKLDKDLASAASAVQQIDANAASILKGLDSIKNGLEAEIKSTNDSIGELRADAQGATTALEAVQKQTKAALAAQTDATKNQEENFKKLKSSAECRRDVISRWSGLTGTQLESRVMGSADNTSWDQLDFSR